MSDPRPHVLSPPILPGRHTIVDDLIEERAVGLRTRPLLWGATKAAFYPLLGYTEAVAFAHTIRPMGGRMAINWVSAFLRLEVAARGVEQVPATGPVLVTANHPGGIADGVAVWDSLIARRPDVVFFANRDALRVCPGLETQIIPVEWREDAKGAAKSRETLRSATEAFKAGRCVVIFPAGRMAQWRWGPMSLVEQPWAGGAVAFARKYAAPIVPLGVRARMSVLYYALAQVSQELRNITLFHELLRKRGGRYRLTYGAPLDPGQLPRDDDEATQILKRASLALA